MYFLRYWLLLGICAICSARRVVYRKKIDSGLELITDLDKNTRPKNIQAVNEFLDTYFLKKLNTYIENRRKDSVPIKDLTMEGKVIGTQYKVSINNVWLEGLSSLRRHGSVLIKEDYPTYEITVPVTPTNLNGVGHYDGRVAAIKVYGEGTGISRNSKLNLELSFNADDYTFELREVKVKSTGEVKLNFKGNFVGSIPTNWVDLYIPSIKGVLEETLYHNLEDVLYDFIQKYNTYGCQLSKKC